MPPEQEPTSPAAGEGASLDSAQITPELLAKVVEKVVEMLMDDLKIERERLGAALGFQRRKGAG